MSVLYTPRLELVPITLAMVEAMMLGNREHAEVVDEARLPDAWPGTDLVERAFTASLEAIRADPVTRLWGDRLMIVRAAGPGSTRRVIGSVVFNGRPDAEGVVEVGYGVEEGSQRAGLATEATRACVEWALAEPDCRAVRATTFPWHQASLRVIEKLGMRKIGTREHDVLGEMLLFELLASS